MPSLLADAAARADDSIGAHVAALQSRTHGLTASLAAARGREKAAAEVAAQDRKSADSALGEASRQAGETAEKLRSTIAARDAELARAADKFERLVAAFEGNSIRSDEEKGRLIDELAKVRGRLDQVQSERLALALDAATAAAKLVEAREAQLKAEAAAAVAAAALAGMESKTAVLTERVRGAENETVRLREETELLYESNKVTKDLLQVKVGEAEELEFQWGQAKAKLAQADSERGEVQAEVSVLEGLAVKAKTAVVKGKVTGKMPGLDRLEQRRWDSLPAL
jgi:chromosome segregation ATPase